MLLPERLFSDERLLLIYMPTTCAWKLRELQESEISGDHQAHDAVSASSLRWSALSMSREDDLGSFLTRLLVIYLNLLSVPVTLGDVLVPEHTQ